MRARVAGLVLAAGEGRRLGRPKALVELDGERLVDRAARVLREGGCDPVYVVTGAAALVVPDTTPVANPDWRSGMASSLRAGLAALPGTVDAVVVGLVDQPGIGPDVVDRLVAAHHEGASVAVATYRGQPRNPVLIGREHWDGVARLAVGDVGARPFLAAHPELVTAVECGDLADPTDIDLPADLRTVRARRQTAGMGTQTGQTKDVGFEIGVSRTVPHRKDAVWRFLTSPAGLALWLGEGAALRPEKGAAYATSDGTRGEVRSFHELDRVRLTWRPEGWDHDTTVQVTVSGEGEKTVVRFHQEWLADADERARQRDHWSAVLADLTEAMARGST